MNDWIVYVLFGLLALYTLSTIAWWVYLIIRAWRESRTRSILLLIVPIAILASLWWVDSDLSIVGLALGTLVSNVHFSVTRWRHSNRVVALSAGCVGFLMVALVIATPSWFLVKEEAVSGIHRRQIPELIKEDCQKLVAGQLVFTPNATMRQGTPYIVSARLSRGTDVHITQGLDGKGIVIEDALVSCMVSMNLDSQEPDAFKIENMPANRKDEQVLLANTFTQWDWRVTPLKSGTLHLLLYVTPMIYVDQVGQGLKRFRQPARVITVSPDYVFAVKNFVLGNWAVWGSILTAIIIPAFIWMLRKVKKRREEKDEAELVAKKEIGFGGN